MAWEREHRHCMHILATHYPDSSWAQRSRIYNRVFNVQISKEKIRDEYGGHKNGRRGPGLTPSRNLMWNDEICRDEFGLPGPFNQEQQQLRRDILQRIQAAIIREGLASEQALMAINMVPGMTRADNNAPALAAAVAAAPVVNPAPAPVAGPASATNAPTAQASASSSTAAGSSTGAGGGQPTSVGASTDPALGGRPWYHTQEVVRIGGRRGHFAYRAVPGLPHAGTPSTLYTRPHVVFSPSVTRSIRVCDQETCTVCRHEE